MDAMSIWNVVIKTSSALKDGVLHYIDYILMISVNLSMKSFVIFFLHLRVIRVLFALTATGEWQNEIDPHHVCVFQNSIC